MNVDNDLKTVDVKVLYKGIPARNFDYTYFDGRDWSNIFSAKDGLGIIELPAMASAKGMQLKTEYMFEGESNIDNELSEVMQSITPIPMRNCYLKLASEEDGSSTATMMASEGAKQTESLMRFLPDTETEELRNTMNAVEMAIQTKDFANIESLCTLKGMEMFNQLIKYGNAKIVRKPELTFLECNGEVTCRSIPMSFSFSGNNRTFVEDITFTIDAD